MNLLFLSEGINVTSIYSNPGLKAEACIYRFLHGVNPEFQYTYSQPPIHSQRFHGSSSVPRDDRRTSPEDAGTPFLISRLIFL
jgi:hypothetical protein